MSEAVGGDLQTILEEGDRPAGQNRDPERALLEPEVTYQANVMKTLDAVRSRRVRINRGSRVTWDTQTG